MSEFAIDKANAIIVEFAPKPGGVQQVSLSPVDLVEKSTQAIDSAMHTIHHMAKRVTDTVSDLVKTPSEVEVSFGLKFEAESGAIIAKAGGEASVNVTLKWDLKSEEK